MEQYEEIEDNGETSFVERGSVKIAQEGKNYTVLIKDGAKIKNYSSVFLTKYTWEEMKIQQEVVDSLMEEGYLNPSKIEYYLIPLILGTNVEGGS